MSISMLRDTGFWELKQPAGLHGTFPARAALSIGSADVAFIKGLKMLKYSCAVLLLIFSTLSARATSAPIKVLIFSKTADYRHASIPAGISAIQELGALHGWDVDATEDASQFSDDNLKRYDVVVWLNTSGNILDSRQKAAYERFQQSPKGTVAIHEAGT